MARKRSRASGAEAAPVADDFKLIRGIGPSFESQLHDSGIRTYDQLTSLTAAKIAVLIAGASSEQIVKQDWISQAQKLASKRAPARPRRSTPKKNIAAPGSRQHYATFTVELLLDEDNDVRRSRVAHIQSGEEDTWAGWQEMRLLDFFVKRAALHLPRTDLLRQAGATAKRAFSLPVADPKGTLHLRDLKVVPANSTHPVDVLDHGQAYLLRLALDLSEVVTPNDVPLDYKATVIAQPAGGPRQLMGEERDILYPAKIVTICLAGIGLPPNLYRLEAMVTLTPTGLEPGSESSLMAFLEGGPLEVY